MRLLIIPSWYPTPASKIKGTFVREQADCLSKTHDVRVLYVEVLERGERRSPRRWSNRERGYREDVIEVSNRPMLWQFSYVMCLQRAISRLCQEFKPDVIHCHVAVPAGWGTVVLRSLGVLPIVPIVLTEHSSDVRAWTSRPGLAWMARKAFTGADVVIAVSKGQKQTIQQVFPHTKRLVVVPNTIDTDRFTPTPLPPTEDGYKLLFIGLMNTPQKGVPVLLDAVARIKQEAGLPIQLDLIGDGALRPQYEAQAARLGLDAMVRFHGFQASDVIVGFLQRSHALVLPSLHESQGVVVIEALSSGRPAISTRCGGPEFVIDQTNGVIVEPGQVEPLARAITEVLTHLDRYDPQQIARNAASRYGCRAVTEDLKQVYASLR